MFAHCAKFKLKPFIIFKYLSDDKLREYDCNEGLNLDLRHERPLDVGDGGRLVGVDEEGVDEAALQVNDERFFQERFRRPTL